MNRRGPKTDPCGTPDIFREEVTDPDLLCPGGEKGGEPSMDLPLDPISLDFGQQDGVVHFIESLGKVKVYGVDIVVLLPFGEYGIVIAK